MAEPKYTKATYHTNAQAVEFIADDGTHVLRSGGSLSWRINNCGNLVSPVEAGRPAPKKTRNYIGFAKVSGRDHFYFIFPDYETGRAELCASLKRKYSEYSIPAMMMKYAPPKDDNDTEAYINALLAKTKVAVDKKLKDFTSDEFNALMDGIETHEGYHNKTSKDGVPRKTTVVAVSTIGATDGARPIADEEIVLEADGKKTTLKSNHVGQFPPIPHGNNLSRYITKPPMESLSRSDRLMATRGGITACSRAWSASSGSRVSTNRLKSPLPSLRFSRCNTR